MVYDAMGWHRPRFGHIPLIHGADGAKLSKRHGAVSVLDFRDQGLLPEAVCNYLLRLGWGHGDEEIIPRARAEQIFDLKDVGRAASRMDYKKLEHVNGVYLRQADPAALLPDVLHRLQAQGELFGTEKIARLQILLPALQERAKNLAELAASAAFAVTDGAPEPDAKSAALLTADAKARLADLAEFLSAAPWEKADLEHWLRDYADVKGIKLKDVAQPLRVALTGSTMSPPIDVTLFALGRDEALARILASAA
jgi:glutamyl-tRNA synthetase